MTLVIEDEKALAELERLAAGLSVAPAEVVRRALLEKAEREPAPRRTLSVNEKLSAIYEFQEWYAATRDPDDTRAADEIIGYNENGLFD